MAGQGGDGEGPKAKLWLDGGPLGPGEGNPGLEEGYRLIEGDGRELIVGEVEGTYRVVAAKEIGDSKELLGLADQIVIRGRGRGLVQGLLGRAAGGIDFLPPGFDLGAQEPDDAVLSGGCSIVELLGLGELVGLDLGTKLREPYTSLSRRRGFFFTSSSARDRGGLPAEAGFTKESVASFGLGRA